MMMGNILSGNTKGYISVYKETGVIFQYRATEDVLCFMRKKRDFHLVLPYTVSMNFERRYVEDFLKENLEFLKENFISLYGQII